MIVRTLDDIKAMEKEIALALADVAKKYDCEAVVIRQPWCSSDFLAFKVTLAFCYETVSREAAERVAFREFAVSYGLDPAWLDRVLPWYVRNGVKNSFVRVVGLSRANLTWRVITQPVEYVAETGTFRDSGPVMFTTVAALKAAAEQTPITTAVEEMQKIWGA